jgi:hypothetical protein
VPQDLDLLITRHRLEAAQRGALGVLSRACAGRGERRARRLCLVGDAFQLTHQRLCGKLLTNVIAQSHSVPIILCAGPIAMISP